MAYTYLTLGSWELDTDTVSALMDRAESQALEDLQTEEDRSSVRRSRIAEGVGQRQ